MKDGLEVIDYHDNKMLSGMVIKQKPHGTKVKVVQHSKANHKANLFINDYYIPKVKAIRLILESTEGLWIKKNK